MGSLLKPPGITALPKDLPRHELLKMIATATLETILQILCDEFPPLATKVGRSRLQR